MAFNVLIMGSTGMVGKGVLLECIDHQAISTIYLINRRPVGITHSKIKEFIHQDFHDFSALVPDLQDLDGCFYCLGVSALGKSEQAYSDVTYEITMKLARLLSRLNHGLVFCYVSGAGTSLSSRSMWARVKGRTEQDLQILSFKRVILFRPGGIQPLRGIKSSTGLYNVIYMLMTPFYGLIRRMAPDVLTSTTAVGLAMISCLLETPPNSVLGNQEINLLARKITG